MSSAKKLKRAYREYNKKFFGNILPNPPEVKLRWAAISEMGYQVEDEIVLNRRDRSRNSVWRFTLLHEMVHLSLPPNLADHGRRFQQEMLRLAQIGAFAKLW